MPRPWLRPPLALLLPLAFLLAGCGVTPVERSLATNSALSGIIQGGQQPVSGATVQLYAVGTTADGSSATPLLTSAVTSDAAGGFSLSGRYTCPSSSSLVYLLATGGNPGLSAGTSNSAIALSAALGPCGALSPATFISVNELTTVAAAYALAPFTASPTAIGASPAESAALASAFTVANQYVNIATGSAPGSGVPAGFVVPIAQLNTIADIVASCINSSGGVAGDGSSCGTLFNLTTPAASLTPANNTFTALTRLALNPTLNTAALYTLISPSAPFQPTQPTTPPDLNLYLIQSGVAALQFTPATVTFPAISATFTTPPQTVTVQSTGTLPASFSGISITGANAADFAQTSNCVSPLVPGASCTLQLTATPAALGSGTASLQFASGSFASPSLTLNETGTAPTGGAVAVSPTHLSWTVANTLQDVTLTNNGSTPLNIKSATSSDPTFKLYSSTCGTQLPAGAACILTIQSNGATLNSSASPATYSGTLTILDDAAAGPQTVALTSTSQQYISNLPYAASSTVSLGSPLVGTLSFAAVQVQTISNNYTASFSGTVFSGNTSDFSATGCTGSGFSPYATTCQFPIKFTPTASGTRTAKFGSSSGYILLTGGSSAAASGPLTLASPLFIAPGTTGAFTLTNSGATSVSIGAISIGAYTLQGSQTFSQTNTCGAVLYAQSVCTINVAASTGSFSSAKLSVATGYSAAPLSAPINLFTAAYPLSTSPFPQDFGAYALGVTSFTATDSGRAPNSPATVTLSGNAADFKVVPGTCNYITGPGCIYSFTVTFVPTALGLRSASFTDLSGTHVYSGFGLSAGPSFITAAQTGAFPDNNISTSVYLGSSSTSTRTLMNTGTATLQLTKAIAGPDASAFSVNLCTTLSYTANTPAVSCTLSITTLPTHLGTSTATLTVTDITSGFSYTYNLSATATAPPPTVSPTSLSFPNTTVGSTSPTQYVTFTDYYHGNISLTGTSGTGFSIVGPTSCGPAPCQIGVAFTPSALGYTSETLTFTDSASPGNIYVSLSGTATGVPALSFSPASLTFAARPVGSTSIPVPITLTNTGTASLTVSSVTIPGAVAGNFTQTNNCSTVAVNATCTINVTFAPTSSGTQSATLSVASNAPASPSTVALSGSTN